jgi:hypothetical protein
LHHLINEGNAAHLIIGFVRKVPVAADGEIPIVVIEIRLAILISMTSFTTATTILNEGRSVHKDNNDDEMPTWRQIIEMRVRESEELNMTMLLLNAYGNDNVTGHMGSVLQHNDDMDARIVVRKFFLQQLILHHVNVMIQKNKTNAVDGQKSPTTTHERMSSWKFLQDIFNAIDNAKKEQQTIAEPLELQTEASEAAVKNALNGEIEMEIDAPNTAIRQPLVSAVIDVVFYERRSRGSTLSGTTDIPDLLSQPAAESTINAVTSNKAKKKNGAAPSTKNRNKDARVPQSSTDMAQKIPRKRKLQSVDTNPAELSTIQRLGEKAGKTAVLMNSVSNDRTGQANSKTALEKRSNHGNPVADRTIATKSKVDRLTQHKGGVGKQHNSTKVNHSTKQAVPLACQTNDKQSAALSDETEAQKDQHQRIQKKGRHASNDTQSNLTSLNEVVEPSVRPPVNVKHGSKKLNHARKQAVPIASQTNGIHYSTVRDESAVQTDQNQRIQKKVRRDENEKQPGLTSLIEVVEPPVRPLGKKKQISQIGNPNASVNLSTRKNVTNSASMNPSHNSINANSASSVYNDDGTANRAQNGLLPDIEPLDVPPMKEKYRSASTSPKTDRTFHVMNGPDSKNKNVSPSSQNGINKDASTESFPFIAESNERTTSNKDSPGRESTSNLQLENSSIQDAIDHETTVERLFASEEFGNVDVRNSRDFLTGVWIEGCMTWACGVCQIVDIKSDDLVQHCQTSWHKKYLNIFGNKAVKDSRSRKYVIHERIQGRNNWKCILCNTCDIRTTDLPGHCNSSQHSLLMETNNYATLDGNDATVEDHAMSKHANIEVDEESKEFLVKSENNDTLAATWTCSLCDITGITQQNLASHCDESTHKVTLRIKRLKEKKASITPYVIEPNATKVWGGMKSSNLSKEASDVITFSIKADSKQPTAETGYFACTNTTRLFSCMVNVVASEIAPQDIESVGKRLLEWDPFWIIKSIVAIGLTKKVQSVLPCTNMIKTAMQHHLPNNLQDKFDLSKSAKESLKDGDCVLHLKMLPEAHDAATAIKSDTHLWPKGTFLQINGSPRRVMQRTQQSPPYDATWKNVCKEFHCSDFFSGKSERNFIQICCADEDQFFYILSYCSYVSPENLYSKLIDPKDSARIPRQSFTAGLEKALEFANQQMTLSNDCDDDEVSETDTKGKFVFSLTCPLSRTIMVTPVRGAQCTHFQVSNPIRRSLFICTSIPLHEFHCVLTHYFLLEYL